MPGKRSAGADHGVRVDRGAPTRIPATQARQGVTRHNVRYVLSLSLGGAVFIFGVVYLLYFLA